jgi:hypothetical protein
MDSLLPVKSNPQTTSIAFVPTPNTDDPKVVTKIPPVANMQALAESVGEQAETVATLQNTQVLDEPVAQLSDPNIYAVLAALRQVLQDGSMNTTAARLNVNTTISNQRASNYADALAATEAAKKTYQDALADFDNKTQALADADVMLSAAAERRTMAQNQYSASQSALAARAQELAANPNDAGAQAKYAAALNDFNNASQLLTAAQATYDTALITRDDAGDAVIAAGQAAVAAQAEVTLCLNDLTRLASDAGVAVPITTTDEIKTALRVLQECMARLADILDKANEDKLNNNLKLYRQKQEQLQKECEQKSREYNEAIQKAAQQQKKMKLIGKIVGGLIAGLSVGAAIVSGGTLSALIPAAVAVSVLIADEILDSQGKQTATSTVMDPIMTPIMKGLTDAFVKFLKGIDPSMSDEAAEVVAMALAMLTVTVASTLVAKGAGSAAQNFVDSGPAAIKCALAKLSAIRIGSLGNSASAIKAGGYMRIGASAAQLSNSGVQATMGGFVGASMQDSKEAAADMKEIDAIMNILKKILDQVIDDYSKSAKIRSEIVSKSSEWESQDITAGLYVLRNAKAHV